MRSAPRGRASDSPLRASSAANQRFSRYTLRPMERQPIAPSLALAAHGESLFAGKRVLVLGSALSRLPEALVERGARLVEVRDTNAERVAAAAVRNPSRRISFAALGAGELAPREGSYGLAIVENFGLIAERRALLTSLRRAVGLDGAVYVASPNPSAPHALLPTADAARSPEYYELFDLVGEEFEHVRMLGLAPLVGYAVADFGAEEPSVTLDSGFLPGGSEEPDWFVALASQEALDCDELTWVQLPAADVLTRTARPPTDSREGAVERTSTRPRAEPAVQSHAPEASARAERALAEAEARVAALEQALELERRRSSQGAEEELVQWKARARAAESRARDVETALENARRESASHGARAASSAEQAEGRAATLATEREQLRAVLATSEAKGAAFVRECQQLRDALAASEAKGTTVAAERQQLRDALAASEAKGATVAAERERLREALDASERKAKALGAERDALRDAGQRFESELTKERARARAAAERAERAEATLAAASETERRAGTLDAELARLRSELAELEGLREVASEVGNLEGALAERGARIRALEGELAEAERFGRELIGEVKALREEVQAGRPKHASDLCGLEADLATATWKIAALEAELEKGPWGELERMRSALQRQATLLAQLRANTAKAPLPAAT